MGSALIAYFLGDEIAEEIALDGGLSPEELHITVAFLPEVDEKSIVIVQQMLIDLSDMYAPMKGSVNGVGRFFLEENEEEDVLLMLPDVVGLAQMRMMVLDFLEQQRIPFSTKHGFIPHVTLKNIDGSEKIELSSSESTPFDLNSVSLLWRKSEDESKEDQTRIDYPHVGTDVFVKSGARNNITTNGVQRIHVETVDLVKAGARNNIIDARNIQSIHDVVTDLGAFCVKSNLLEEEEKSYKHLLWSEMDFDQRRMAIVDTFFDKISFSGDVDPWDVWIHKIFDDHFLVFVDDLVFKFEYTVLNDKEIIISREGIPGKLEFVPIETFNRNLNISVECLTPEQARKSINLGLANKVAGANNLKTIDITGDEWRVGNYMVLFGGEDLTGEHFSVDTDFESEYTKTDTLIEDWEHGLWPDGIGPKADEPLGKVLWKDTMFIDDVGVFVERVLNRQNKYLEVLRQLQEAGSIVLGTSSEAVPDLIEKTNNGSILSWGFKRDALTVTPLEPRMLTNNRLDSLKSRVGEKVVSDVNSVIFGALEEDNNGRLTYMYQLQLKRKALSIN